MSTEPWPCPKCGLAVEDDENAALLPDSGFMEAHVACIPEGSLAAWAAHATPIVVGELS